MPNNYGVGEKIRAIRNSKKLSQSKVVEKLREYDIKMSRETLSKIENYSRSISAEELKAISNVLGIDIIYFFDDDKLEDMVTFFRKRNFSQESLNEIGKLQEMIKVLIEQESIYEE